MTRYLRCWFCAVVVFMGFPALALAGNTASLSHVKVGPAGGVIADADDAKAALGSIKEPSNDVKSGGNPLLGLLNTGSYPTKSGTSNQVTFSDDDHTKAFTKGIFEDSSSFTPVGDSSIGTPLGLRNWTFVGKSDESAGGPFNAHVNAQTGVLMLDDPVSGVFVISLKAGTNWAVYAFDTGTQQIQKVYFDTAAIPGGKNLSHASYFTASGVIPEPGGIAIWLVGLVSVSLISWQRRRKSRK